MRAPLTFESLASAFFIALAVAAFATQASTHRRTQVALLSAFIATGVIAASQASEAIRGWLGHAYLVAAYWIPALLIPSSDPPGRFEWWLVRSDQWCRIFAISPPAWAASIACVAMSSGVSARWGDMLGVCTDPVTAQEMMTFSEVMAMI